MQWTERPDLRLDVTFIPNKPLPVYNWLYYKEGFARDFVLRMLKDFKIKPGMVVLDPFCGVGTTLLACKEQEIESFGNDVSSVAVFAASVKTRNYDLQKLKNARTQLLAVPFKREPVQWFLPLAKKAFSIYAKEDIEFLKYTINKLFEKEKEVHDFFWLALIQTSTKVTYAEKHGGSIRINKKRHVPPFRKLFAHVTKSMLKDLEKTDYPKTKATIIQGDARKLKLKDASMNAIITSPPYLNKIEYANVYVIEQEIFFQQVTTKPAVKSFIEEKAGVETEDVFHGKHNLPILTRAYFKDMKQVMQEWLRVLKKNGKVACVVGNGCFPEGVVESDALLAELAEDIGFKVKEIAVLNKRWCMKNRSEKVALMNESLILLEKP